MNNLELDKVKLIQKKVDEETGAVKLIGSINKLQISDKRSIVEHKTTGVQGGVILDQGRSSTVVTFEGVFLGEEAKASAEELRAKFKVGVPIQILSDISGVAEINQVLIEDLNFVEGEGYQQQYRYSIQLREYVEPPQDDDSPPDQEEEAENEAEEEAKNELGSENFITGEVFDVDEKPIGSVDVKITYDDGEYNIKTNENGIFRKDNLDPGKYIITIDSTGFEDFKKEVVVKQGKEKSEIKDIR